MKLYLVHNSEHFINDSYCYHITTLQLRKLWLGAENLPKVSRKISGWVRTRTQASWPSMQSTFKYTKGPKALRSYPPRAVNGQHGFKSKSSLRFSTSTREEGRCESMRVHKVLLQGEAGQLHSGLRLSLLGFTHKTFRSRMLLSAKGNKLSGGCWPICSDETLPNPDLPLVSFQGISWRKDKQQLNHSCRNNKF